ncbi:hypothetical protein [Catenulispora subtropica]|uniref:Lipoprotein n=1 Tax=Catenulispora subtropica TaxID=450798 RepID=A0ABP5CFU1_9ACTN
MPARFRSPVALAAVCVSGTLALGIAGCASEGVVGGGAPGNSLSLPGTSAPTGPGSSGASASGRPSDSAPSSNPGATTPESSSAAAPSSSSAQPADPSALASSLKKLDELWTDPGCKLGLRGFGNYLTAAQESPAKGDDAIPAAIRDLRAGATSSKRPDATLAMNNMTKDLQAMADAAKAGQTPDKGKLSTDWQIMGNACMG